MSGHENGQTVDAHAQLLSRVRREYFAKGAALATKYGVTIDEILAHLERAELATTPGPSRVLSFIEDLVAAVACCRGHPQAWYDTWTKHEAILIRASRMRLSDGDAVVFARRFWIELHSVTMAGRRLTERLTGSGAVGASLVPLTAYSGVRPLRIWLTDRLLGTLESALRDAIARRMHPALAATDALVARVGSARGVGSRRDRCSGEARRLPSLLCEAKPFVQPLPRPSLRPLIRSWGRPFGMGDEPAEVLATAADGGSWDASLPPTSESLSDSFWSGRGEARLRLVD